jgi:hypothetical protein
MSLAVRAADTRDPIARLFAPGAAADPRAWDRAVLGPALAAAEREARARPDDPDPAILRAALLLRLGRREEARQAARAAAAGTAGRPAAREPSVGAAALLARILAVLGEDRAAAERLAALVARRDARSDPAADPSAAGTALLLADVAAIDGLAVAETAGGSARSARSTPAAALLATLREAGLADALPGHMKIVRDTVGDRLVWAEFELFDEEDWPPFAALTLTLDPPADREALEETCFVRLSAFYRSRGDRPAPYLGHLLVETAVRPEDVEAAE